MIVENAVRRHRRGAEASRCWRVLLWAGFLCIASWSLRAGDAVAAPGKFKAVYSKVKDKEHAEMQKALREEKLLETIAEALNETINVPVDITMTFSECDEANAYYDPETREISICYELIDDYYETFSAEEDDEDKVWDQVWDCVMATFFHELGHALIDVLELPITGKEEDAADQLADVLLLDGTEDGDKAVLAEIRYYELSMAAAEEAEEEGEEEEPAFWDTHSLDQQRYYNSLCFLYGQNAEKHAGLVEDETLPEDRAAGCEAEFAQIQRSWAILLAPHLKDDEALEKGKK